MSWINPTRYPFTQRSVVVNAPMQSGVYALHNGIRWIYVGETSDILAQLVQLLNGDNAFLTVFRDLTFSYELLPEVTRAWRRAELVREFRPICNAQLV
ncbi:MAG: hypothetical protein DMD87_23645 [Candidatus Rokuibacteriota bacterium]|nr:MAG: hypothetical protein DMD87_23645 [Candidatus Rokubacteria bacterium]